VSLPQYSVGGTSDRTTAQIQQVKKEMLILDALQSTTTTLPFLQMGCLDWVPDKGHLVGMTQEMFNKLESMAVCDLCQFTGKVYHSAAQEKQGTCW
jgi:hypothetical protein